MIISIQSISDIITNSSSEVYLNTWYDAIDNFKIIIEALSPGMSENFEFKDWGNRICIIAKDNNYKEMADILNKVNDLFYASDSN